MNFTYQNHLRYTIADRLFGERKNSIEKYTVNVGTIDTDHYKNSSYQEELRRTADLVYSDFGNDFVVFLSGGTDSEIVVRNFISIGIKPKCVTIRFTNGFNASDVREAEIIAEELNLPLEIIDFDITDFYYSGQAEEFGNKLQCTQITYLMVYFNILKLGVPAVMGGELLLRRQISMTDNYWFYTFRENEDASAMRFSNLFNIPVVNEWFSYTPELMLYYLEDHAIQSLVTAKDNFKLGSVSSKNAILRRLYPSVRKKEKTHGFERLLVFNLHEAYQGLEHNQIRRLEPSLDGIPMNTIISTLRGEI